MNKNQILLIIIVVLGVVVVASSTYVILFNNNTPVSIGYINSENGADVTENSVIKSELININGLNGSKLSNKVIQSAKNGTPVVQFGNGEGPVSVVIAGIHGDQIPPQIAALKLIDHLSTKKIKGTVYIIPFAAPEASSNNEKYLNGKNLNKIADEVGTSSNDIVMFAISKNSTVVGDFHSTAPGANPGHDVIMCSQFPTYDSYLLAMDISKLIGDSIELHTIAGVDYNGAIEDVLNQKGIPSVTGLSTSFHGEISPGSVETSFNQMLAMLKVNGNIE